MSHRERIELPSIIHCQNIPLSIQIIVMRDTSKRFSCQICTISIRYNINMSSATNNSLIQFNILIAYQTDIIISIFLKNIPFPTTKWNSIDFHNFTDPQTKARISHAKLIT